MKNSIKDSNKIREKFISFFKENAHKEIQSSSLIPKNDSSILFTNSGMVQFKKWFTGEDVAKHQNIVTVQKCVRAGGKHNDLDNVGFTPRHHTFFEMLGNFSFGGYFKEEAIEMAWNLLVKEFSVKKERLIVTVFKEDEISSKIWKKISGFSDNRIIKISSNDNFWSMGDTGPCGPCSEIFFDNGDKVDGGMPGTKNQDGNRFVEIWNLVFMEFEKKNGRLLKLPGQFVDTGMGLERISAVLSGKINNYETDLFEFIFKKIGQETNSYLDNDNLIPYRIISDHIKSIIFMMSEGILPSNEGRGYVLRRIIRRALLNVNKLKQKSIILHKLVDKVIAKYEKTYKELKTANLFIKNNLKNEEEKFSETLNVGLELLNKEISILESKNFNPEVAYKLYDTFGFPIDMTNSILNEKKIKFDIVQYKKLVETKKEEQRKTWVGVNKNEKNQFYNDISKTLIKTEFCGYQSFSCKSNLVKIFENERLVNKTKYKKNLVLIFNKTPFYAEAGGQVGDTGDVYDCDNNLLGKIHNTQKIENNIYLHFMDKCDSNLEIDGEYTLVVNGNRRKKISNNHSATHLLHESLRQVVGLHVSQRGSFVSDTKLRFDYTSNKQLSIDQQKKVEEIVNNSIRSNLKSQIEQMTITEAKEKGAIALFGEKYPDIVRVVSITDKNRKSETNFKSIELCGGTHVNSTGEIGLFKILSDVSVASGVRRVEAITGQDAEMYFDEQLSILGEIKQTLKANNENILEKIKSLKNISSELKNRKVNEDVNFSDKNIIKKKKFNIYYDNLVCSSKELRNSADKIKKNFDSGIIVLSTSENKKVSIVVAVTDHSINKFDSNDIIKKIILFLGGKGGGGRKDLSQGGAPLSPKFKKLKEFLIKNFN